MKKQRLFFSLLFAVLVLQWGTIQAFATDAAQDYIDSAPFSLQAFAQQPMQSLANLLLNGVVGQAEVIYTTYLQLLAFLLLGTMLHMLLLKSDWVPLLELLVAGGSFLLVSDVLLTLADDFASGAGEWQLFLLGFIPVFASVVLSCGESVGASLYSGFFLVAVSTFAQLLAYWLVPAIECYLAFAITSAFWIGDELPDACKTLGKLLKKLVAFAGTAFTFIFGIQRVFSAAADGVVIEASKTLGSTVPIVGQTVSSAASTFLAGMQVIKTGLGFAAIAVVAVEFLPLYCTALLHLCLLSFAGFLCKLFSFARCGKLFDCLCVGIEALMAVVALFFFMLSVGTALMIVIGAGG